MTSQLTIISTLSLLFFLSACGGKSNEFKTDPNAPTQLSKTEKLQLGVKIYEKECMSCHTPTGKGIPSVYPPLAKSDYLTNNLEDAIHIVMHGRSGNITVNGKNYNNIMTNLHLQDHEIASVLTYVLDNWGNSGKEITIQEVKKIRTKNPKK